mmetsp:Transcript_32962/g.82848  ORF Transcript_32962/g.82848 Transcript_32962/m.82848 type:complete len:242 (-) Transcript_32962:1274-1999(-)
MEKGIKHQNAVDSDGRGGQQHGLGRAVKRVRVQGGLDHDQRVVHVLVVQAGADEGRLVRRVVEHLQHRPAPQVEHELRVEGEGRLERERRGVVFAVVAELGAQSDEGAVQPAQHVGGVLASHLVHADARHHDGRRLLVEAHLQHLGLVGPHTTEGGDAHHPLSRRSVVLCDELEEAMLGGLPSCRLLGGLKVEAEGGLAVHRVELPRRRAAHPNFRFCHVRRLFLHGGHVADGPAHLHFAR